MTDFKKQMEMVLYHTADGDVSVEAYIVDESIWVTQKAMADIFGIDKSGISRHLKNIFESKELDESVVVAKNATTTKHGAIEGKTQKSETNYYNLDAIISDGRISHKQALDKAYAEYEVFNKMQKIDSDFDEFIKGINE